MITNNNMVIVYHKDIRAFFSSFRAFGRRKKLEKRVEIVKSKNIYSYPHKGIII